MATAKKSARKTTASKSKAAAARTTKKSTSKKVAPTKTAKVTASKARSAFDAIRSFLRGSVLVYAALAAAVAAFTTMASRQIYLTIQERDLLASSTGDVLAPASEVLFNLRPEHWLAVMLGVSALGSLLLASKLRDSYEASVNNNISGWRWLYIGVTAGLTIQFVSMLAGIGDIAVLKMSAGLVLLTALLGWLAERENSVSQTPRWLAFVGSLIAGFLAWLPVLISLVGTSLYGAESFDWYVYAVSAVFMLASIGFAINKYRFIKGDSPDYIKVETNYWRIDFLYKLAIAAIILAAV